MLNDLGHGSSRAALTYKRKTAIETVRAAIFFAAGDHSPVGLESRGVELVAVTRPLDLMNRLEVFGKEINCRRTLPNATGSPRRCAPGEMPGLPTKRPVDPWTDLR
jgi:hypothetical protein